MCDVPNIPALLEENIATISAAVDRVTAAFDAAPAENARIVKSVLGRPFIANQVQCLQDANYTAFFLCRIIPQDDPPLDRVELVVQAERVKIASRIKKAFGLDMVAAARDALIARSDMPAQLVAALGTRLGFPAIAVGQPEAIQFRMYLRDDDGRSVHQRFNKHARAADFNVVKALDDIAQALRVINPADEIVSVASLPESNTLRSQLLKVAIAKRQTSSRDCTAVASPPIAQRRPRPPTVQLLNLQAPVAECDAQLLSLQAPVAEPTAQLLNLQAPVAEPTAQLLNLQAPVAKPTVQLLNLHATVERDVQPSKPYQLTECSSLQATVAERDAQLLSLQATVAERDAQLAAATAAAADIDAVLTTLDPVTLMSSVAPRNEFQAALLASLVKWVNSGKAAQRAAIDRDAQICSLRASVNDRDLQLAALRGTVDENYAQLRARGAQNKKLRHMVATLALIDEDFAPV